MSYGVPLVVGLMAFTVGAFVWHMFTSPSGGS